MKMKKLNEIREELKLMEEDLVNEPNSEARYELMKMIRVKEREIAGHPDYWDEMARLSFRKVLDQYVGRIRNTADRIRDWFRNFGSNINRKLRRQHREHNDEE